jgi:hypothetical protein
MYAFEFTQEGGGEFVPGSAVIRIDPGLNLGGLNDWRRIAF